MRRDPTRLEDEAALFSQIEITSSSLSDLLYAHAQVMTTHFKMRDRDSHSG